MCICTSTVCPEALDKGCFVLASIDAHSLLQKVDTAVKMNFSADYGILVSDYAEKNVSTKTVRSIQSDTGMVDNMV